MTQIYSDPKRESEPHALPDVETFYIPKRTPHPQLTTREILACPLCREQLSNPTSILDRHANPHDSEHVGWYWQSCFPGCLPDGEPNGPFATEQEAIADAQSDANYFPVFYLDLRRAVDAGSELQTVCESGEEITAGDLQMIADALGTVGHARADVLRGRFEDMAQFIVRERGGVEERDELPPCVLAMKCYCAGHARGNPASDPCDTSEESGS